VFNKSVYQALASCLTCNVAREHLSILATARPGAAANSAALPACVQLLLLLLLPLLQVLAGVCPPAPVCPAQKQWVVQHIYSQATTLQHKKRSKAVPVCC
jgi:hypothetical protein